MQIEIQEDFKEKFQMLIEHVIMEANKNISHMKNHNLENCYDDEIYVMSKFLDNLNNINKQLL